MGPDQFSKRFGVAHQEVEISVRDDAPAQLRGALLAIANGDLGLAPSYLRSVLCGVLRRLPDRHSWSEYPNIWTECQELIEGCSWYRVYDFVEALYLKLRTGDAKVAARWQELVNDYFVESGVGWRLVAGQLESRGSEEFALAIDEARDSLARAGLPTARQEIVEALRDLSRRPEPDLSGAIHHAMAALECAAREAAGDPRATLGQVLKTHPGLFPKPVDEGVVKLWGYASESGRHLREGQPPNRQEAELIVGVAALCCRYLADKLFEQ